MQNRSLTRRFSGCIAGLALIVAFAGSSTMAMGAGGGGDTGKDMPNCKKGQYFVKGKGCVAKACPKGKTVWKNGRCVASSCKTGRVRRNSDGACIRKVELFTPEHERRFLLARSSAYAGKYREAIALLEPIKHTLDPRVLNFLGFSNRKLGRIDTGLAYYKRALEINPDYTLARSYLGEGYLQIDRLDLAKVELGEIGARCGTFCDEYIVLQKEISRYKARHG